MKKNLPEAQNLAQKFWQNMLERPERAALTILSSQSPDLEMTRETFLQKSVSYANALRQAGITPGRIVILILQHGQDLVSAFWGAVLSGAVPSIMPFLTEKLLPDHYRHALESLFEITKPAAVITYADFMPEVHAAARFSSSIKAIIPCEQVVAVQKPERANLPGIKSHTDDIVLLQHSSGTTGLQKGVALTHQAVINQLTSYSAALHLNEQDVIVSWLPLYHDMGLIAGFILPIMSQVPLILMSPFDWVRAPYKLMQAISKHRGTLCWLPNFAYNFCAQKSRSRDLEGVDLSSMRAVINCSEPMQIKSHQGFLDRFQAYGLAPSALATCYAMAENVFAVTQGGISEPVSQDLIDLETLTREQIARPLTNQLKTEQPGAIVMLSAGRPIKNTQIRIISSTGVDLPERHIGEIAIRSNCMLASYYHRPDLTKQAFQDGWYLTGDLGYMANGELFVTGRKKDLIIVGGKNIYPQDLERLSSEVSGVHPGRVVAFGVYNEVLGTEDVVLVAEIDNYAEKSETDRDELSMLIRQHVTQGSDVTLRRVVLVNRNWLLKTSSGKIARLANKEKFINEFI